MFLNETQTNFKSRIQKIVKAHLADKAEKIESTRSFPAEVHEVFARERLYALALPVSHGGIEADAVTLALMVENIARYSPSAALLVFPTNAVARIIAHTGTDEQKDIFLREIGKGDKPMAFCLTEPDHGSDVFNLTTFAADTAMEVANLASRVLGQAMARNHDLAARLFCVAKGIQIFDGSNQIQRLIISRNLTRL